MQTGTKISGVLHVGALGFAVFGGALFSHDTMNAIQVADVSIITSQDFDALQSSAPETAPEPTKTPEPAPLEPNTPVADENPQIETPVEPEAPTPEPLDQTALLEPSQPVPAPRIDTQSAPKPAEPVKEADTTIIEAAPDETATQQTQEEPAQAPKEAATEIVTEADEKPSEFAPQTSAVPPRRPRDIKDRVAKANAPDPVETPKEQPTEEQPKDNTADEIAKALAAATKEAERNAAANVPTGPPLTGSEREGLVLAVQKCWNVPIGLANADDLAVVLSVDLTRDGDLASNPKLIEPSGAPAGAIKQAFEAGRRALILCAPYSLPADKYEQWRTLEVVFNPERMVVK